MFGMVIEKEPIQLTWPGVMSWLQIVGGFAAVGLVVWLLARLFARRPAAEESAAPSPSGLLLKVLILVALAAYAALAVVKLPEILDGLQSSPAKQAPGEAKAGAFLGQRYQDILWTVGGGCALLAVSWLMLVNVVRDERWQRIWAIARVSLKEAVRRKVLWAFLVILVVFLFASWFVESKPEDQWRTYVNTIYTAMHPLLLVPFTLLAALSIPNDIRHQTIYTILTKPVERFELVLGRFLGYVILMTGVLLVLTAFSLGYIGRSIHPAAQREGLHARVPIYGDLEFYEEREKRAKGENVGREWDYRSYIAGKAARTQYAVWTMKELPTGLDRRDTVPCEFGFDIYRTTKGEGVAVTLAFKTKHLGDPRTQETARLVEYQDDYRLESGSDPEFNNFLAGWYAAKYGYFAASRKIADYHTYTIDVPATLFRDAKAVYKEFEAEAEKAPDDYKNHNVVKELRDPALVKHPSQRLLHKDRAKKELERLESARPVAERRAMFLYRELPTLEHELKQRESDARAKDRPPLQVWVSCDTRAQFAGMAKPDLYLLDDNQSYVVNFFKGASGLWVRLVLAIGLAVVFSTYLSGIIAWLVTMFLYVSGYFQDFIQSVVTPSPDENLTGPLGSFLKLVNRKELAGQLDETAAVKVSGSSDAVFRWVLGRFLYVLPDVDQLSFTNFVAEGFNISLMQMATNFLWVVGYLLLPFILAFYLMKWREVASAT